MSGLQQASNRATTTASGEQTTAPPETTVATEGNQAQQDALPAQADAGLAEYQATLGKFLGGQLYRAVSGVLTYESMSKLANQAVDGAVSASVKKLIEAGNVDAAAGSADALVKMLQDALDPAVSAWLASDGKGLNDKLKGWVDANPLIVASVAALAAAGAVIANLKIPELKKKFALGDNATMNIEAALGSLRQIALQKLKVGLEYKSGPLLAALEVAHAGGETTGQGSLSVGDDEKKATVEGQFDGQGLKVAKVGAMLQTGAGRLEGSVTDTRDAAPVTSVALVTPDGKNTYTTKFDYDTGSGDLTVREDFKGVFGNTTVNANASASNSGAVGAGVSATRSEGGKELRGGLSAGRDANGGLTASANAGYSLTEKDFKLALDAEIARSGDGSTTGKLSGSVDKTWNSGVSAGGSLEALVGDQTTVKVAAYLGYQDPATFTKLLLKYQQDSGLDERQFSVLAQRKIQDFYLQIQHSQTWSPEGSKSNSQLLVGKDLNADYMLIGGVRRDQGFDGAASWSPVVGVQKDRVQVLLGVNPEKRQVTLGLGISF